jgi:hypothetical protein
MVLGAKAVPPKYNAHVPQMYMQEPHQCGDLLHAKANTDAPYHEHKTTFHPSLSPQRKHVQQRSPRHLMGFKIYQIYLLIQVFFFFNDSITTSALM